MASEIAPGQSHGTSLKKRILRAGLAVGIAHLCFKLAGLFQARAMGHYLDPGTFDVVYAFAFENCIFSIFLIGEEVIGPAFLPVFMRECGNDLAGEKKAWNFAGSFLSLQFLILVVVVGILVALPGAAVRLFTSWTPESKPEIFALAANSVRHLAPALIGLSLGSTTYVLLNAYKRFFLAAFGDAVWKFTVVGALVFFAVKSGKPAEVLIWGLVGGSVLKLCSHLVGLRDKLGYLRPSFSWRSPVMKSMAILALPLLAGIIFAKFRDIVNNVYVLSALDADGLMQANSMGRKLQGVLQWLVPYTLSIAVFPFFCEMADKGDREGLGDFITRSGRQLLAVFLPFAAVVAVLAQPLTELVFGGGRFDALAVQRTSVSMACYTFALPAAAIEAILMQAFFASRRTLAVSVIGIFFSAVSVAVSFLGLHFFRDNGLLFLGIVAGGFALSRWLKTVTLIAFFRKSAPAFPPKSSVSFLIRLLIASAFTAAVVYAALPLVSAVACKIGLSSKISCMFNLAICGIVSLVGVAVSFALLRINEPLELVRLIRKRRR